jgi:CheY-like chemotaxis protein
MDNPIKILFVDDELFFAQPYVEALRKFSQPTVRTTALEAVEEFQKRSGDYACGVLDVMMPPPPNWDLKTKEGLDTGIEVLRLCSAEIIAAKLPVIVLTHRALKYVVDEIRMINFPKGLVEVRNKLETRPFLLEVSVERLIREWKQRYVRGDTNSGGPKGPK